MVLAVKILFTPSGRPDVRQHPAAPAASTGARGSPRLAGRASATHVAPCPDSRATLAVAGRASSTHFSSGRQVGSATIVARTCARLGRPPVVGGRIGEVGHQITSRDVARASRGSSQHRSLERARRGASRSTCVRPRRHDAMFRTAPSAQECPSSRTSGSPNPSRSGVRAIGEPRADRVQQHLSACTPVIPRPCPRPHALDDGSGVGKVCAWSIGAIAIPATTAAKRSGKAFMDRSLLIGPLGCPNGAPRARRRPQSLGASPRPFAAWTAPLTETLLAQSAARPNVFRVDAPWACRSPSH